MTGKLGPEGKREKGGHAQEILIPWQIQTGIGYNKQFVSLSHIQAQLLLAKTQERGCNSALKREDQWGHQGAALTMHS